MLIDMMAPACRAALTLTAQDSVYAILASHAICTTSLSYSNITACGSPGREVGLILSRGIRVCTLAAVTMRAVVSHVVCGLAPHRAPGVGGIVSLRVLNVERL